MRCGFSVASLETGKNKIKKKGNSFKMAYDDDKLQ